MKYILILVSFIPLLSYSSEYNLDKSEPGSMSILHNNPVFKLNIDTFGVAYEVLLNGFKIIGETDPDTQLETTLPVNLWMHSSQNTLKIYCYPSSPNGEFNPNARLSVELIVLVNGSTNPNSISTINFSGEDANTRSGIEGSSLAGRFNSGDNFTEDDRGDVLVGQIVVSKNAKQTGGKVYERVMDIPSSIPLWEYFKGRKTKSADEYDAMSDHEYYSHMDELLAVFTKIQTALVNGDPEQVIPLFEERNKETDLAYYLEAGTTESKLLKSMKGDTVDPSLKLMSLTKDFVNFSVAENNLLISLVRAGGHSAILYEIESGGSMGYPIYFRKGASGWVISR